MGMDIYFLFNLTIWASAEEAIQRMQGTMIGQQAVHLSWGRSPTAKQDLPGVWSQQADPSQWSSTYYGYGQGYMMPMVMGLRMILHYMYMVHTLVTRSTLNRCDAFKRTLFFPFCWMCCPDCSTT
ncbi:Polyadenylate-binding protein RBP47C' [Camellia lanceoleosa]|uniref:Polyadenylate-binding protein RBP47C n=1 Tax=Camellia lanceoleosa TaxID=1840588 RepID=A0ACC0GJ40_9ERIC|nr:Polyadenylate-binding protein RBP47C' [Camellia lanceoleosa]